MRITHQITTVIFFSMVLLLLFTILFSYYSMNKFKDEEIGNLRQMLLDERKSQLRDLVQNAYSVLEASNFYEPAQAALNKMRFGEKNQNYFFVIDPKGMFWVNPAYPKLVGKAFPNLKDINGKRYIEEIIERANVSESAFINYQTYRNDSVQPSTKLVHFKAFKKWNWIICAGMFIDDIEAIVQKKQERIQQAMLQKIKLFALGELLALMISGLISVRFFRIKLVKPIMQLTQSAEDLIVGNFDNDISIQSSREINQLADAMQRMQDSFSIACNLLKARSTEFRTEPIPVNQRDQNKLYKIASKEKSIDLRSAT